MVRRTPSFLLQAEPRVLQICNRLHSIAWNSAILNVGDSILSLPDKCKTVRVDE